ncbi:MAG: hypothetical protein R3240_07895 [Gammaproteobacteria bacterium]|nr:hypothetical protein [Gammaproteobacteria bacterium]
MRLDRCKYFGLITLASAAVMSGCASQGPAQPAAEPQQNFQAAAPVDNSAPAIPVTSETVVPVAKKAAEPPKPPEPGTMASVVDKMNKSPFTLYWREKGSYSYHVGNLVDAEYQPGTGLTLKGLKDHSHVVCQFNAEGKLEHVDKDPNASDQCSKLMFTLDTELGD